MKKEKKTIKLLAVGLLASLVLSTKLETSSALFRDSKSTSVQGSGAVITLNNVITEDVIMTPGKEVSTNITFNTNYEGRNKITVVSSNIPREIKATINGVAVRKGAAIDLGNAKSAKIDYVGQAYSGTNHINSDYEIELMVETDVQGWGALSPAKIKVDVRDYGEGKWAPNLLIENQTALSSIPPFERMPLHTTDGSRYIEYSDLFSMKGHYVIRGIGSGQAAYEIDPEFKFKGEVANQRHRVILHPSTGQTLPGKPGITIPGSESPGQGSFGDFPTFTLPSVNIYLDARGNSSNVKIQSFMKVELANETDRGKIVKGMEQIIDSIEYGMYVHKDKKIIKVPREEGEYEIKVDFDYDNLTISVELEDNDLTYDENIIGVYLASDRIMPLVTTIKTGGEISYEITGDMVGYRDPAIDYKFDGISHEEYFKGRTPLKGSAVNKDSDTSRVRSYGMGPPGPPSGIPVSKIDLLVQTHLIDNASDESISITLDSEGRVTQEVNTVYNIHSKNMPTYRYFIEWEMYSGKHTAPENVGMYFMERRKHPQGDFYYHPVAWPHGKEIATGPKYGEAFGEYTEADRRMHLVRVPREEIVIKHEALGGTAFLEIIEDGGVRSQHYVDMDEPGELRLLANMYKLNNRYTVNDMKSSNIGYTKPGPTINARILVGVRQLEVVQVEEGVYEIIVVD